MLKAIKNPALGGDSESVMHSGDQSNSPTGPVVGRISEATRLIKSGLKSITPRERRALLQFLGFSGLLKTLLDQLGFCMRACANAQREGKCGEEEGLNRHGLLE